MNHPSHPASHLPCGAERWGSGAEARDCGPRPQLPHPPHQAAAMPDVAPDLIALALRWRLPDAPPLPPQRPHGPGGASAPGSAGTAPSTADDGAAIAQSGAVEQDLSPAAASIQSALADGAERELEPEGWLVLVRPDGRRLVLAPRAVAKLERSGHLPFLPEPAERAAGAACARPPSWSEVEDAPEHGDRCVCGGNQWWRHARPPHGWWCAECHPLLHTKGGTVKVET